MKDQYNVDTTGLMSAEKPKLIAPDLKIKFLEDQLVEQQRELLKLRRDIGRLKSQLDDVANMVRTRG